MIRKIIGKKVRVNTGIFNSREGIVTNSFKYNNRDLFIVRFDQFISSGEYAGQLDHLFTTVTLSSLTVL